MEKKSLYDLIMGEPHKGTAKVEQGSITEAEFFPHELESGMVVFTHKKPDFVPEEHQEINP